MWINHTYIKKTMKQKYDPTPSYDSAAFPDIRTIYNKGR